MRVVVALLVLAALVSLACTTPARAAGYPTTDRPLLALDFVTARLGWVVGDHRVVLRTTIGGDWWTRQGSQRGAGDNSDVCFVDSLNGWLVGRYGVPLRRTTDGGATWVARGFGSTAPAQYANRIKFVDRSTGWALFGSAADGTGTSAALTYGLMRSVDGGLTWTTLLSGSGAAFGGFDFIDAQRGWIAGRGYEAAPYASQTAAAEVLATMDGGVTWTRLTLPSRLSTASGQPSGLLDVDFTDAQHGVAVGWTGSGSSRHGVLLTTADGGLIWSLTVSTRFTAFTRASMATAQTGWVVGQGGGRRILCTVNGGRTWTSQWLPAKARAADVDAVTAKVAFACGQTSDGRHGMVARTQDGGAHWVRVR